MKSQLTDLIVCKLAENKDRLKDEFFFKHSIKVARHFALDNLLPVEVAEKIYSNFPNPSKMRLLKSYGELKLKYIHIKSASRLLQDIHLAIQNPRVVDAIEDITEIKNQLPDSSPLAGGISTLLKGHYINPHLDNSHDLQKKSYRTVNLLYYVSPNWKIENGGNYELWDESIENRILVPSYFNRLVVMETNRTSWHAVNPVLCDEPRCCVFNYYFSKQSPEGEDYFHSASSIFFNPLFRARPEEKTCRVISSVKDAFFRITRHG